VFCNIRDVCVPNTGKVDFDDDDDDDDTYRW
jgi:hypothetical protein